MAKGPGRVRAGACCARSLAAPEPPLSRPVAPKQCGRGRAQGHRPPPTLCGEVAPHGRAGPNARRETLRAPPAALAGSLPGSLPGCAARPLSARRAGARPWRRRAPRRCSLGPAKPPAAPGSEGGAAALAPTLPCPLPLWWAPTSAKPCFRGAAECSGEPPTGNRFLHLEEEVRQLRLQA